MAHTTWALLVLLVAAAKKGREAKKCGASSGLTTKLEQSISLDIYDTTAKALERLKT